MGSDVVRSVVWVFSCNALFVLLYTALRLEYLAWNWAAIRPFPPPDIARAFLYGLRFDVSAVFTLSAIPLALVLLPLPGRMRGRRHQAAALVFFGLQLPFIALNAVDMELANFVGHRATWDTLLLAREVPGKFLSFVLPYWELWVANAVLLACLLAAFLWLSRRRTRPEDFTAAPAPGGASRGGRRGARPGFGRAAALGTLTVLVYALAIRGAQSKPLTFAHANVFPSPELNSLVLNSTFTMVQSLQAPGLRPLDYFRERAELVPLLNGQLPGAAPRWPGDRTRQQNVVILIMESFGQEYMGAVNGTNGFTPFLDSLAERGLFFTNNYANGRRTIVAMQSILAGLPPLMSEPLMRSQYANVRIKALGESLGRRGYRTAFFHGGHNGTMYFDQFARMAGFREYYGFDEYPAAKRDDDGAWGVYDDPFFQFMLEKVSGFEQPFLVGFYSLTSHHPYPVPAAFKDRFPKGSLEIFESLGYADHALAHFFAEAEQQEWYKDTLFVVTGDHTEKPYLDEYNHEIGRYRVPLIFFQPDRAWPPVDTSQVTQHADIVASILDVLGVDEGESLNFGRSVFAGGERYATLFNGLDYYLLDREWNLRHHPPDEWFVYDSVKDPSFTSHLRTWPARARVLRARLQATLQYFHNGLIENDLIVPDPAPVNQPD